MNSIVTRCARRDSRLVCGGSADLADRKVAAHRADRRAVRAELKAARYDAADFELTHRAALVTGWDVS